ncbi:MAG: DUF3800 domain-containing protein [Proteobacteria bacterium]|nr:DUF3800 domain-containing protein [Pseudomonadota bacterium]
MKLYLDESGNSGETSIEEEHLEAQPFFVLAGIGIPSSHIELSARKVEELTRTHRIQSQELKARSLYKKKPVFIQELVSWISDSKIPVFVEAMDKKYFLAIQVVSTVILPGGSGLPLERLDRSSTPILHPHIAELVCTTFSDETFSLLCRAYTCATDLAFERYLDAVIEELIALERRGIDVGQWLLAAVYRTREIFEHLVETGENKVHRQFMLESDKCRGRDVNLLPHTYAFSSIVGRAEKYRLDRGYLPLSFVHDNQHAYSSALQSVLDSIANLPAIPESIRDNFPRIESDISCETDLSFSDSKSDVNVQIADVLAGTLNAFLRQWKMGDEIRPEYWDTVRMICELSEIHGSLGINFVMCHSDVESLQRSIWATQS